MLAQPPRRAAARGANLDRGDDEGGDRQIEKQALDLRTQVVGMGLLSADAKLFLESLAPIEENMRALDFAEIEKRLEKEQQLRLEDRRRLYGGGG